MKIQYENNKFTLKWKYSIKNNVAVKQGKEYYSYNTTFPAPLFDYFGQSVLWMYSSEGRTYICVDEHPQFNSKPLKLFEKGRGQCSRNMTLSKKFFRELTGHVDGFVEFLFHIDAYDDMTGRRGLVELRLVLSP